MHDYIDHHLRSTKFSRLNIIQTKILLSFSDKCPAGTYRNSSLSVCTNCSTNSVSETGATVCSPCKAGTVSNENRTVCGQ